MSQFSRTTRTSLTFLAPFSLSGFDLPLPAGTYWVDTEEEALEGNAHVAFRRIATTLVVQSDGRTEYHSVPPSELEIALRRDRDAGDRLAEALNDQAASPSSRSARGWLPPWLRLSTFLSPNPDRHSA